MVLFVASASVAEAVTPTTVPAGEFSATSLAAPLTSVTGPTSNSSTSSTAIVKLAVLLLPSALAARTVIVWLAAASRFRLAPAATVTTPLLLAIANRPPASSVRLYVMVLFVASASVAEAVTPTTVPAGEFSATSLAAPLTSVTGPTSNSSTSSTAIVKLAVLLPSVLAARTVIVWLAAASRSRLAPAATVTTPLLPAIANRPPASSVRLYVMVLFVASASVAEAVTPTTVPAGEFSATSLAAPLTSVTGPTSNSSTSSTATLRFCTAVRPVPSLTVTCTT